MPPTSTAPAGDRLDRPTPRGFAQWRRWLAPRCVACDFEPVDPLCAGCAQDYFAPAARCSVCAARLPPELGDRCGRCLRSPPHFDQTTTLADYAPLVDKMGTALKFGGRLLLADAFGRLIAERAAAVLRTADAICAVPLAFKRQAERGFSQAHEISRRCAAACGRKARPDLLLRTRHTAAQMQLSLADCQRNVRGVFVARGDLAGACIAVVDDVMTSGVTLDEVAAVLKRAGARHVVNLIVARTP